MLQSMATVCRSRLMAREEGASMAVAAVGHGQTASGGGASLGWTPAGGAFSWESQEVHRPGGIWVRRRGAMPISISRLAYGGFIIDAGKMP
jgi:hypothetical protein